MKKKIIIIGIIMLLAFLIIYFGRPQKIKKFYQATQKEEKYHTIQYSVNVDNITISGKVRCKECSVRDVILMISHDVTKKGFESLPVYNESLICFLKRCGKWKVLFNGNEVKISDKIGDGKVEIIWEGE